jgi:hypothetical protein
MTRTYRMHNSGEAKAAVMSGVVAGCPLTLLDMVHLHADVSTDTPLARISSFQRVHLQSSDF